MLAKEAQFREITGDFSKPSPFPGPFRHTDVFAT